MIVLTSFTFLVIYPKQLRCGLNQLNNVPQLNGQEILNKLREDLHTAKIPLIFLTSEIDSAARRRALQLGANDCLTKPINNREFLDAIAIQLDKC